MELSIFKTSVNGILFLQPGFGKRLCYNHSVLFALVFYSTSALFAATRRLTPSQIDTVCMCCCRKATEIPRSEKRNMIDTDVFEEKHESSSPSVVSKIQCLDGRANLREGVIILVWAWHLSTWKRIYIYIYIYIHFKVIHPNKFSSNAQHPWIVIYLTLSPSTYVHIYTCI